MGRRNVQQTCCIQESTCSPLQGVPTLICSPPRSLTLLGFPDRESKSCKVEREASEAACSTALWTVGAAVGPKLREKEEIDHAVCMMLKHDRLRRKPNVSSVREESLFTPWWVCEVREGVGFVCVSYQCVCVCFTMTCGTLSQLDGEGLFLLTDVFWIPDLFLIRDFKSFSAAPVVPETNLSPLLLLLCLLLLHLPLPLLLIVGILLRSGYPGVMLFVRERQSVSAVSGALSLQRERRRLLQGESVMRSGAAAFPSLAED